ncbi:MAG: hypothetical protein P8Y20_08050 [Gammaproteobacteria bacterium]
MTEEEIKEMLKTDPARVGRKLFRTQQRMNILLEMLNELNGEMLKLKVKELSREKSNIDWQ